MPKIHLDKFDNSDFERGASAGKEFLWWIVRALFFIPPLPIPSSFKNFLLRLFGATIGTGVVIRSNVNITFPWRLHVGDHVWIGDEVFMLTLAPINIGDHVCISQRAFLCTGSHDFYNENFSLITKEINIKNHSWIGANATICPGVTIGEQCLVTAGTVVKKDILDQHKASGQKTEISALKNL